MTHSKPVATCVEVIIITIVCLLVGACLYISMQYNPAQNENTTKSIIPIKSAPLTAASIKTVSFTPIQQPTTPNIRMIKLITIHSDEKK